MSTITIKKEDVEFMKKQFHIMVEELNKKDLQLIENKKELEQKREYINELESKLVPTQITEIIPQSAIEAINKIIQD